MNIQQEASVRELLWYNIGGKVKYLLECSNRADIEEAVKFIKEKAIQRIFVCGTGSNLIFTDHYFDGAVIRITKGAKSENTLAINENGEVEAFAGLLLDDVIQFAFGKNLIGLEWAGGLPGTVGAAVRGNVGAYGGEIKDSLVSVDVLDYSGEHPVIKTVQKDELQFAYRTSFVKTHKKMVVLTARFGLQKADTAGMEAARDVYEKRIQQRKQNHPLEYPNCGSVFKNLRDQEQITKVLSVFPELADDVEKKWHGKMAVAAVIEKLGLKGFRIGDAQVSEKHALFIINLGYAKAGDVLEIIDTIQKKFQETFGFQLETEVEIVH
ncbi:MAG TPA: UDP-N-acetylmuramate dehydrogenase [Patescibacteria group bacterium]|nr:UDP-N-acetylmuramate dehydrogenase [Patescibacteria group bacterium]